MIRTVGSMVIEVVDERTYTFGSADSPRPYQREEVLGDRRLLTSRHAVAITQGGQTIASVVLGAIGGGSGVHERSLAVVDDVCYLAIGPFIVCLELPTLATRWVREVDSATCFGIHVTPDGRSLVSHGELEIARVTLVGEVLWRAGGRDIFTGDLVIDGASVRICDFYQGEHVFDLETGALLTRPPPLSSA